MNKLSRRILLNRLRRGFLALAAFLTAINMARASTTNRFNVLFLVVDDLRPELGCYGRDYIQSPNIDRLASTGVVFDRAYCQQAVCSPSRSSVLTGARPDTTKVWDLKTHFRVALPDVVTLPQDFKEHGYFVQGMGKVYHGGYNDPPSWSVPWQNARAPIYALPADAALAGENIQGEPDGDPNAPAPAKDSESSAGPNSRGPIYESADVPDNTFTDGKVADLAVKTLDEISRKSEPFFLAVGFIKPHLPWVAPKKYWNLYDPAKIDLAPNPFYPVGAPPYAILTNDGEVRSYKGIPARGHVPDDIARKLKQAYFASVSYSDAQVGRVLDELDRLHLRTNTIIVLWGDHGWKLGEHDAWGKHDNVENDVNAPLIVSAPGIKAAGQHSRALVEFVDIYPTLCDLAGIPKPSHLEGASFTSLLDHPDQPWKPAAFSQYPRPGNRHGSGPLMGYTMRTDRYRFTVWTYRQNPSKYDALELYDHQTDPQENTNIVNQVDQAATVDALLKEWKAGWHGALPPAMH